MTKPATVAITVKDGGEWIPFTKVDYRDSGGPLSRIVHAIAFDDGSIWDACGGFRNGCDWRDPENRHYSSYLAEIWHHPDSISHWGIINGRMEAWFRRSA